MNNKRMMIGMLVATAFFIGWMQLLAFLDRRHPEWNLIGKKPETATTAPSAEEQENPITEKAHGGAVGVGASTTQSFISASTAPSGLQPVSSELPMSANIGMTEPKGTYAIALAISPRGAGLESVVLNDFKKSVNSKEPYLFQEPYAIAKDSTRPLATRTITVDGVTFVITDTAWKREEEKQDAAVYTLDLAKDGKPAVRLRKTFELRPRTDASAGYETIVTMGFENLTDQPLKIRSTFNGPTTPPREVDRGPDRQIVAGYLDRTIVLAEHHFVEEYTKDKPTKDVVKSGKGLPMLWAGAGSVYFDALIRPDPLAGTKGLTPAYIEKVETTALNPEDEAVEKRDVAMVFHTSELAVDPQKTVTIPLRVFLGPRKRGVLDNAYFSALPFGYDRTLVISSGPCSYCTFDWLIGVLVWMLQKFQLIVRDWGLAIICLVCLVRVLLHPITKRSQVSMMKMGKMGPEMERLKKKYGDDKDELNKAMMQFYKEQGFKPVLGCLPMFLQMPIWIALWSALQTTFEFRHAPFLKIGSVHLTWIDDLAKPDYLIHFKHAIAPFAAFGWESFQLQGLNLLPVLLAVVFYFQQKMTPQPPASTPEQQQQQKMMRWMSLLFPVFLYNGASGLNLYILTSTSIGIVESKIIRKHIKEREEAEKAGKVFVETKPTRQGKNRPATKDEPKKSGIMGWLADLQARAEEMRDKNQRNK